MSKRGSLSGTNRGGIMTKVFGAICGHCSRSRYLTSKSLDKELSWQEKLRHFTHLATCSSCRHYRHHLQIIRRLIRCYCHHHPEVMGSNWELSVEARERMKRLIRERMRQSNTKQRIAYSRHRSQQHCSAENESCVSMAA